MTKQLISIVLPAFNEEASIGECYQRLSSVLISLDEEHEIIFVDDGSTDRTLHHLEELAAADSHVKVISFSRNFGHQVAVTAGIDKATGDAIVVIDADLQDPPEIIPQMVALWKEGYAVVYARRKKRKGETRFKLLSARLFYRLLASLTEIAIPPDTGDFRLIDRRVADVFRQMPERNRFIRGMISWAGFRQAALEYERDERYAGETKYPLRKMFKFALDGILSFSFKPLKLVSCLGLASTAAGLLVAAATALWWLAAGEGGEGGVSAGFSPAWLLLAGLVLFMGGVQLLSMGLLGEYIGRIYDEAKNRPLYVVDQYLNW